MFEPGDYVAQLSSSEISLTVIPVSAANATLTVCPLCSEKKEIVSDAISMF